MALLTSSLETRASVVRRKSRSASWLADSFTYLFLFIAVVMTLFPVVWMALSSLKPADEIASTPLIFNAGTFSLTNYAALLSAIPLTVGFGNTLVVLLVQGAATLLFCPLAGFAFAKFTFRGKKALFTLVLGTLMLPPIAMIIPLLFEMGALNWMDTYQGLIAPGLVNAFAIFWSRQQIATIPDELLEAARIDGCTPFSMYWRIVLPVIRPALAALSIFTFLSIYNDFVWPVIVANSDQMQTLQVMLSNLALQINNAQPGLMGTNVWGEILAASTLATVPVLILFVVLQRQFIRGILAGSVKG